MTLSEQHFAVLLHGGHIGVLRQRGDHTAFTFTEEYLNDESRPVLGLRFEEDLRGRYSAALRLPRWFSNLLPEGPLREWIAADRDVALDREMELLAQVGHDLPGAVQVLPMEVAAEALEWPAERLDRSIGASSEATASPWRFSLAGVALKFSMLAAGDRLTAPALGEHGDWLVKFPDQRFGEVPLNEFVMMSLAAEVGLDVPEVRLVHRDELQGLPSRMWLNSEEWAYAVRRFDRRGEGDRTAIHIEDFAQVRDKYPDSKYEGTFETVAALAYRGRDLRALQEMARRLAFNVLIGNGDAHLKNWSLIYLDERRPTLSPAYDLVSTVVYGRQGGHLDDLGLKLGGSKRFDSVRLSSFARLEARLDRRFGVTGADLHAVASAVCEKVPAAWERHRDAFARSSALGGDIGKWIDRMRTALTSAR